MAGHRVQRFWCEEKKGPQRSVRWSNLIRCERKYILDNNAPPSSTQFSEAAEEAMSLVPDEMKSVCMFHDVEFRDLLEAHEDVAVNLLEGK